MFQTTAQIAWLGDASSCTSYDFGSYRLGLGLGQKPLPVLGLRSPTYPHIISMIAYSITYSCIHKMNILDVWMFMYIPKTMPLVQVFVFILVFHLIYVTTARYTTNYKSISLEYHISCITFRCMNKCPNKRCHSCFTCIMFIFVELCLICCINLYNINY